MVCFSLFEITQSTARSLSKHQAYLDLSGVKELTPSVANDLTTKWGDRDYRFIGLNLNGLVDLSAETAEVLSNYPGHSLNLNGLKTLSPEVATALSRSKCNLGLFGLEELSDAAADAFSKYQGRLNRMSAKEFADGLRKTAAAA